MQQVCRVAGTPNRTETVKPLGEYERIRARGSGVRSEECWLYNATKDGAVAGACFFKSRVHEVLIYNHG